MSAGKIGSIVAGIFFLLVGIALFGLWLLIGGRFPFWAVIVIVISVISLAKAFTQSDDD